MGKKRGKKRDPPPGLIVKHVAVKTYKAADLLDAAVSIIKNPSLRGLQRFAKKYKKLLK